MSYREKYRVSGYRSLPSSNRSSIYNLHTADYNANINEDLTDFDRQFKKLLERTEKFTNRVEKLQSTATYIRRGFRKIDTTVLGLRSSRDAIQNDFDYLDNKYELDDCPSTEEEWRKYVDLGILIEKAVEILRYRYRCPKPVFEYSPEDRSPYSIDITPRALISPPKSPTDREGRRIRDLGSEIHHKYSSTGESTSKDVGDEKRKSPLLSKRKVDKFETKLDALTEIEEPRSPVEKSTSNSRKYSFSSKNQINTNFNSSSIFNKGSETSAARISIDDDDDGLESHGKGKRKSFLETLKNAASKRIGRSSDIKDEKEKRKTRTTDDMTTRTDSSPVKLRSNNQSFKKSYSIDDRKNKDSGNEKNENDTRVKRLSSSSSFHEYNPSNRIPLRERLRMKEMEAKKDNEPENDKENETSWRILQGKGYRESPSPEKTKRTRHRSESSTNSTDDEPITFSHVTSSSSRNRLEKNKSVESSSESKASTDTENMSSKVRRTLKKSETLDDDEPQPERLPLRERRKHRMMSDDSEADSMSIDDDGSRKNSVDTMFTKRFSIENKEDEVTRSPAEVLKSARMQKESALSSSLNNRIQIARQRISRTNEILSTVESDIRHDLTLRESYTLQWEEKQRKMSEEKKSFDKKKLERDQPYLYTNERPVKQQMKKYKHNTSDLMEKLQRMFVEVEEDRVVPTKHRSGEKFVIEFKTPPTSSVESIIEIEDPLEMVINSDKRLSDSLFDALDEIEPPKYPSDDEIMTSKVDSPITLDDSIFDRAYEYTLHEDEIRNKKKKDASKNEEKNIAPNQEKEEHKNEEIEVIGENINRNQMNTNEEITSIKSSEETIIMKKLETKQIDENELQPDDNAAEAEAARKQSVTISINLNSPTQIKKEFDIPDESANETDEIVKEKDVGEKVNKTLLASDNEDIQTKESNPLKDVESKCVDGDISSPAIVSVSKEVNLTIAKKGNISNDAENEDTENPLPGIEHTSKLQYTDQTYTDKTNNKDHTETADLPRPQSSMDLLLEELEEMNRELFQDIEEMQQTSNSRIDLCTVEDSINSDLNSSNQKIFSLSQSFDNNEDLNSNSIKEGSRPASVCNGSPFVLPTIPVSFSQENLNHISKSNPEMTRGSSDSLFTISKILANKSDNSLQTFSQYKEWNSKEKLPSTSFDENNNFNDQQENSIKKNDSVNPECNINKAMTDEPVHNRTFAEQGKLTLSLSRKSLSDSSEILYLKDSSQIKMGYREKREAHLKLLEKKKAENDSIPESDEVFPMNHEENKEEIENVLASGIDNFEKTIESTPIINGASIINNQDVSQHPSLESHMNPEDYRQKKLVQKLSTEILEDSDDDYEQQTNKDLVIETEQMSGHVSEGASKDISKQSVGKAASFENSSQDILRQQNKARTYYKKRKSTSDDKREKYKDDRIHSKSVEHY